MNNNRCDFCSDEFYKKQNITEKESVQVWYPIRPIIFGHFLIITKRHVQLYTELTNEELVEIKELIAALFDAFKLKSACDGFNILNNNLIDAGQHISHTHLHVFMRKRGEVSPFKIFSDNVTRENISKEEWRDRVGKFRSWMTEN